MCQLIAKTDVGRQRLRNEDNFLLLEKYSLSVVADGMGGHVDGNIASQIAVDTIKSFYQSKYNGHIEQVDSKEELIKLQKEFLTDAVQEANRNIFARNRGSFALEGMGTTIVVLQVEKKYALTACVGDSRIYLLRQKTLKQVTQDHSLVSELVRYNIIDEKDKIFLQNKNIITRALGMTETVSVDITKQEIFSGDLFLLCSDGLTDLVENEKIEAILNENYDNLDLGLDKLIEEANNLGGQDNITVSLVKINEESKKTKDS